MSMATKTSRKCCLTGAYLRGACRTQSYERTDARMLTWSLETLAAVCPKVIYQYIKQHKAKQIGK